MKSQDYHDYVIKDGKFIGQFDDMYKDIKDPWNQTDIKNHQLSHARNAAILDIARLNFSSVAEIGCGLGYYTSFINRTLPHIDIIGIDISETAINKAKEKFPHLNFEVGSIMDIEKYAKYEVILCSHIMWYILQDIDQWFELMLNSVDITPPPPRKYFINIMSFYAPGVQKYGCDYFTTLQEFINYIPFPNIGYTETYLQPENVFETCSVFEIKRK
jgi:SAM-dependent methyltransferase